MPLSHLNDVPFTQAAGIPAEVEGSAGLDLGAQRRGSKSERPPLAGGGRAAKSGSLLKSLTGLARCAGAQGDEGLRFRD